ncbi:hypothetical protein KY328_01010 [Candidatus Woesearchaeota archaeon]|nr:hypothetical protein [Candidatus Woesearchaeota archaeon]MBW3021476.1 hypothetical protein [Candidatus Woesearchaeota archaeon]
MFCETRVATYLDSIEDLIKRYSNDFIQTEVGREDVIKYRLPVRERDKTYLLMVSKCLDAVALAQNDYNVIVTVMGERKGAKRVMRGFQKKTKLQTRLAPEHLNETFRLLAAMFF